VHKINALIISSIILFILGCEDKNTSTHAIPIENTTEVLNQTTSSESDTNRFKITRQNASNMTPDDYTNLSDTFKLSNMQNKMYTVSVSNKEVIYKENTKGIVLVTFFATWCLPCLHDIPYMNDLQKKYKKELLLTGILVQDTSVEEKLRSFLAKYEVNYFVSNSTENNDFASLVAKTLRLPKDFSIPLTVMYVGGKYFTHYEGCVPIEMIDYDIQQALKMLKK